MLCDLRLNSTLSRPSIFLSMCLLSLSACAEQFPIRSQSHGASAGSLVMGADNGSDGLTTVSWAAAKTKSRAEIIVNSQIQLSQAVASAKAGDTILVKDGTYSGSLTLKLVKDTSPEASIILRAANVLGAKFRGSIQMVGNDWTVEGFDMASGSDLTVSGLRNRVSRFRFLNYSGGPAISIAASARNATIEKCEIEGSSTSSKQINWFGIRIEAVNGSKHIVRNNYFHDKPVGGDDHSAIGIGFSRSDSNTLADVLVEGNLFKNWFGDPEVISVKSSGNIIRYNTVINSNQFVNRHGERNQWLENHFEDSGGLRIHDRGNSALGNRFVGKTSSLEVMAGDITPTAWDRSKQDGRNHPSAENTVCDGNRGDLQVGKSFEGDKFPAVNTLVKNHEGNVDYLNETQTRKDFSSKGSTYPIPTILSENRVGPHAP